MKLELMIKMLLRTPLKTMLTLVLLTSISFVLFSKVGEFVVTTREFNKVASSFKGVLSVEHQPPEELTTGDTQFLLRDIEGTDSPVYETISTEDITAIENISYVSSVNKRYMTAGIGEDYVRVDDRDYYYSYGARLIVEGKVAIIEENPSQLSLRGMDGYIDTHRITITECELLAGDSRWDKYGYSLETLTVRPEYYESDIQNDDLFEVYNIDRLTTEFAKHDNSYVEQLKEGQRYVFVIRYEPLAEYRFLETKYYIGDKVTELDFDTIYSLEDKPENYLETDEFAGLRQLMKITNDDIHTFDMVYTDDMSSIMRFAEKSIAVSSGRGLTKEDSDNKAQVCVVSELFMVYNGLSIGDKISMKLGDKLHEQFAPLGAIAHIPSRLYSSETTVELEIVGAFRELSGNKDNQQWQYNSNTIFLPLSLLPVSQEVVEDYNLKPSELSFSIDDAWDISRFVEKSKPILESRGLTLMLSDGGWSDLERQFTASKTLSAISVITLSAATIMTIGVIVYLFIGRKKNDYAIMRAIGTTVKVANRSLFVPLAILAVAAVVCGNIASWFYTNQAIAHVFDSFSLAGYEINTSIPVSSLLCCVVVEMATLLGFAKFGLWRLSLKKPLVLLQADEHAKEVRKKKEITSETTDIAITMVNIPKFEITGRQYGAVRHTFKYILLFSRRAAFKTVLSVMLAALMFGALGQFAVLKRSNEDLYEKLEVGARFSEGIRMYEMLDILNSGYLKSFYYVYVGSVVESNSLTMSLFVTNNIDRLTKFAAQTEYAEGYDSKALWSNEQVCVLGASTMDALGVKLGDTIDVFAIGTERRLHNMYTGYMLDSELNNKKVVYTVVGRVVSEDTAFENGIYIPLSTNVNRLCSGDMRYRGEVYSVEFIINDNSIASEFKTFVTELCGYSALTKHFVMDTDEAESIAGNIRLFNALFPVVTVILTAIGGLLPGFMIVQAAKEAAILRILGTSKERTRAILGLQQLTLSLFGMFVGIIAIWAYNGSEVTEKMEGSLIILSVLYFSVCVCAIMFFATSITRRKPLDLLQDKE